MAAMPRRLRLLLASALIAVAGGCANLNFYSDAQLEPLSLEAYQQATDEHGQVIAGPDYEMVQRVAARIAAAAEEDDFAWEARLLRSDVPNAFCLPNGRIAIFTGILPITKNEDGLAIVMGHEVAHAIRRHAGKRMTRSAITAAGLAAAGVGLSSSDLTEEESAALLAVVGVGTQLFDALPYSRSHESEADVLGLRYAIRAGYDPNEAPALWERMAQLGGDQPEFLSTHPSPLKRAENLRQLIPRLVAEDATWDPKTASR